ncbi:TPA: hypothetical protein QDB15_004316 [Burkholderia vietnamiensis]|uniref:hypothetical protein n=1 Tax=Burkholderia cepacia complex TaxID=87882 RepID=UPI000A3EECB7|nr:MULTISPECIES: hypothetical protein [Burkholderia cepacia complex]MCA8212088.1 hypothetical protein [Burkholderia vietnamiensis]UKD11523.1 hypothetical protein L3V59_00065 [Burkholderia aenigmatica]HDR9100899.1 hypothetical protein [Burkholderia vietnamiensis]HDR9120493.1 hypothetical protein [Burkholderia vietnamiensis]HDR9169759.1 hypothetical protein [Burkholderia vietnamiensis]
MTVAELIAAARNREVDSAQVEALRYRVMEAEERYEQDAARKSVSDEGLSRTYSL